MLQWEVVREVIKILFIEPCRDISKIGLFVKLFKFLA